MHSINIHSILIEYPFNIHSILYTVEEKTTTKHIYTYILYIYHVHDILADKLADVDLIEYLTN